MPTPPRPWRVTALSSFEEASLEGWRVSASWARRCSRPEKGAVLRVGGGVLHGNFASSSSLESLSVALVVWRVGRRVRMRFSLLGKGR